MSIYTYLSFMLVAWSVDGLDCYANGKKFKFFRSFFSCILWPISLVVVVLAAAVMTRNMPD